MLSVQPIFFMRPRHTYGTKQNQSRAIENMMQQDCTNDTNAIGEC